MVVRDLLRNLLHLPQTSPVYLISQKSLCSVTGHERHNVNRALGDESRGAPLSQKLANVAAAATHGDSQEATKGKVPAFVLLMSATSTSTRVH